MLRPRCKGSPKPMATDMNNKPPKPAHKLGANRKDPARKAQKQDPNFAQSKDIREDRVQRQMKSARARQTVAHPTRAK